jgi:hypothetical protein
MTDSKTMSENNRLDNKLLSLSDNKCLVPSPTTAIIQTKHFDFTPPTNLTGLRQWVNIYTPRVILPATEQNAAQVAKTGNWVEVITGDRRSFWWNTKTRDAQWNVPSVLLHCPKGMKIQEFICKGGVPKWWDEVAKEGILTKPEVMKRRKDKKARRRKETKTGQTGTSRSLIQQLPLPSYTLAQGVLSPADVSREMYEEAMSKSPMQNHIGYDQIRSSFLRLQQERFLFAPSLEQNDFEVLLDMGNDPYLCHNLNHMHLQASILTFLLKDIVGISVSKALRLRLKAWYERFYLEDYKMQKVYADYLWKHRNDPSKYWPPRLIAQQKDEFKNVIRAINKYANTLKGNPDYDGIPEIVGFLFHGQKDIDPSVNVAAWNFKALDFSRRRVGPHHAPWFPDKEHVHIIEHCSDGENIKAIVEDLRTMFEGMENELMEDEVDSDNELVEDEIKINSEIEMKDSNQNSTGSQSGRHDLSMNEDAQRDEPSSRNGLRDQDMMRISPGGAAHKLNEQYDSDYAINFGFPMSPLHFQESDSERD